MMTRTLLLAVLSVSFFFFSCGSETEPSPDEQAVADNDVQIIPDEDTVAVVPDDPFTISAKTYDDVINGSQVSFVDAAGTMYYSRSRMFTSANAMFTESSGVSELLKIGSDDTVAWAVTLFDVLPGDISVTAKSFDERDWALYIAGSLYRYDKTQFEMFLVKVSATGEKDWTTFWGAGEWSAPQNIAIDPAGDVVVAGYTTGAIDQTGTKGECTNPNAKCKDAFVSKFNSSGGLLWTKQSLITDHDEATAIATDALGNYYISWGLYAQQETPDYVVGVKTLFLKWDGTGNEWWRQTEEIKNGSIVARDIQMMSDGRIALIGFSCEDSDNDEICWDAGHIRYFDAEGTKLSDTKWNEVKDFKAGIFPSDSWKSENDELYILSLVQVRDDALTDYEDMALAVIDKDGKMLEEHWLHTVCNDMPETLYLLPTGTMLITGSSTGRYSGSMDNPECYPEQFVPFLMFLSPK